MRKARSGRILNVSSIGGYRGAAGFGVYSSTKFAVEGLSEALHAELAPLGIHVTVVEPVTSGPISSTLRRWLSALRSSPTTKRPQARCAEWRPDSATTSRATHRSWRTCSWRWQMYRTRRSVCRSAATPSRRLKPSTRPMRRLSRLGAIPPSRQTSSGRQTIPAIVSGKQFVPEQMLAPSIALV
jgi:NAD(P)-dependent dehydrogenase (short-subunit alcohol dehydrogenase family)